MYRIASLAIMVVVFIGNLAAQNSRGAASDTIKVKKQEVMSDSMVKTSADTGEVLLSPEPEIFVFVEEMPEFPGGEVAMNRFIADNMNYPDSAIANKIQGRVVVQFVIDKQGNVVQVKIVSKPLGWGLDEEAVRVIRRMPKWKPGKQKGRPVNVRYVVPIRFQLQ